MEKAASKIKEIILDILFPKFCINCKKEGSYLCLDCFYLIDILDSQFCPFCWPPKPVFDSKTCRFCKNTKKLSGLFCAASYSERIVKNIISQFKYPPYVKELSKPLAELIIAHLLKTRPIPEVFNQKAGYIIIPVPLHRKKIKKRGFNQSEEIAKELSKILKIPFYNNVLVKTKQTPAQMELDRKQRKKNVLGAFSVLEKNLIENKKILLVDDVFTTGTTLEECAKILKQSGAKQVWGAVIARG